MDIKPNRNNSKKICHLLQKMTKKYDFELADIKAKLNTAESELKNRWGNSEEDKQEGQENVGDRIRKGIDDVADQGSE